MKVLLVGNYPYLKSQSMDRFAGMLDTGLKAAGHQVRFLKPPPAIGRMFPSATGFGKWLGYLDRFILFRPLLKQAADWADVVHICDQANAMYIPWLKGKPHVVTCHDMLAIRSALGEIAEHQTGLTGRIYQRWILSGLKKAMHVACVSDTTREDVLRLTGLSPDRVSAVQNGLNYPYRPMSERESLYHIKQMGLANVSPFFINVGNNNWYKNKEGLLRIFGQMAHLAGDEQGNLVIVGAGLTERLRVLAQKIGICDRIRELSNVTNEQLCALYSAAEGLIFPSLFEGFGWPIIEAQACGCPVFTSNQRPMTEVGGDGAVYFDLLDDTVAAKNILQAIQGKDILRELGHRNAMKYSTAAMITGYVRAYHLSVP
jgi:glycosyltransferase involved in cell wall biosynthesis